jgi:hypothetical protein
MSLFQVPQGLIEVAHFNIPKVQTWGNSAIDSQYKVRIREIANIQPGAGDGFEYFVFS